MKITFKNIKKLLFFNNEEKLLKFIEEKDFWKAKGIIDSKNMDVNYRDGLFLVKAVDTRDLDLVKLVLNFGTSVSSSENEPLLRAVLLGKPEIFEFLLISGADINARGGLVIEKIFESGNCSMMAFILRHSLLLDFKKDECLKKSSYFGCTESVKILLRWGANPKYIKLISSECCREDGIFDGG